MFRALNYGSIGVIIGHEITHGFDDMGRQNDKDGNLVQWWTPDTEYAYLEKALCIVEQYDAMRVPELDVLLGTEATVKSHFFFVIPGNSTLIEDFQFPDERSDDPGGKHRRQWRRRTGFAGLPPVCERKRAGKKAAGAQVLAGAALFPWICIGNFLLGKSI